MNEAERSPQAVLSETAPMLSLIATRHLYAEQPELWKLGERGRAHTIEDFNHHFHALTPLQPSVFRTHVAYCKEMFESRGFPLTWLSDAWRWMERVIVDELPPHVAEPALHVLRSGIEGRGD